ncbi:MAG: hypothetical protein HYV26_12170 [Candidatus Hydrogenedentes bacterium]|nr:hypothetical protein [Candidatus Hydrogenedentota bacterium]
MSTISIDVISINGGAHIIIRNGPTSVILDDYTTTSTPHYVTTDSNNGYHYVDGTFGSASDHFEGNLDDDSTIYLDV